MSSICRLCGVVGPLIDSHIVPDFFIRSLERRQATGSAGQTQPFSILKSTRTDVVDGAKQRGQWEKAVGLKGKLLCSTCEGRFSKYEGYVRELLYGTAPPPLVKITLGTSVLGPGQQLPAGYLTDVRKVTGVDYKHLRLFQLSLLWRADVAKGSFFKNVSLGAKHEAIIRGMLLAEDPGKESEYSCVMLDLHHNGYTCEDFIQQPEASRDEFYRIYKMIIGGYLYIFYVSSHPPPTEALRACVKPRGEMEVLAAKPILKFWADVLGKAGKL